MSDKEQVLMTFDSFSEIFRPDKFVQGDLGGIIIVFKMLLKVVETLMEAVEGQEIKDRNALIGLLL